MGVLSRIPWWGYVLAVAVCVVVAVLAPSLIKAALAGGAVVLGTAAKRATSNAQGRRRVAEATEEHHESTEQRNDAERVTEARVEAAADDARGTALADSVPRNDAEAAELARLREWRDG